MESKATPVRVRFAVAFLVALASFAAPIAAEEPDPARASRPAAADPLARERWVDVLSRESASPDPEIARSARAALDVLGERGRAQRDGDPDRHRSRPRFGDSRPAASREREAAEPGFSRRPPPPRARDEHPRAGPFPSERGRHCGPGCCLHGAALRGDAPPRPDPRGLPPGPPPGGPHYPRERPPRRPGSADERGVRPEHGPSGPRPPRPPFPDRDESPRPPRPTPKEA